MVWIFPLWNRFCPRLWRTFLSTNRQCYRWNFGGLCPVCRWLLARPLGGLVFGHYGDKIGRKKLLQISLIIVGITTFLMGCIPTFHQIGYWAPTLLVILRLIQGFAFGGEWGGAVILVSEHSPDDRRGYWASWPQTGVPLGNLVATLVLLLLSKTSHPNNS